MGRPGCANCSLHTPRMDAGHGPIPSMGCPPTPRQCLLDSIAPIHDELLRNVQQLWQLDTVPQWEGKEVTRSKQDRCIVVV